MKRLLELTLTLVLALTCTAVLAPAEKISAEQCLGRILASASVGCPPAVPIAVPGERLDEKALAAFHYYGISKLWVMKLNPSGGKTPPLIF